MTTLLTLAQVVFAWTVFIALCGLLVVLCWKLLSSLMDAVAAAFDCFAVWREAQRKKS